MYTIEKYTYTKPAFPKDGQDPDEETMVTYWVKYGITWKDAIDIAESMETNIHWQHYTNQSHGLVLDKNEHYTIKKEKSP